MKKSLIATAFLGAMGFASAAMAIDAANTFTWTGSVPAAPVVGNNWVIKSPTGQDLTNGILVFRLSADGKGELAGSTEIAFNVFEEDAGNPGTTSTPLTAAGTYDIELTSLAVNSAGLAGEQAPNGYYQVLANGTPMTKGAVVNGMTADTLLTIGIGNATATNQPQAGDSVDLQATVVVTNAQI